MKNTVAFTGHRPDKLGGYDWYNPFNLRVMRGLRALIIQCIEEKEVTNFIFGGALGVDSFAFAIVLKLKIKYPHLHLTVAVPFKNQPCKWNKEDQDRYYMQLKEADTVIYVDTLDNIKYAKDIVPVGEYHVSKMHLGNMYMVDNCHYLIAVWRGLPGGTQDCVYYAQDSGGKINEDILILNPTQFE